MVDISIDERGTGIVASLSGRLTFQDHTSFLEIVDRLKKVGTGKLTLDLNGLEFIDSAGMGMFLLAQEKARETGARIALRGARGPVKEILSVVKFDALFEILD
ncbi:MAG TPA: anti-sigma factor antagonist [Rhodospirillales bacterium]|nr:anti-sigma factor antagonist [Rhodospirillales bacterium]